MGGMDDGGMSDAASDRSAEAATTAAGGAGQEGAQDARRGGGSEEATLARYALVKRALEEADATVEQIFAELNIPIVEDDLTNPAGWKVK